MKGISPVLATLVLIAITLIAAVAIAGFVFGIFGTFTGCDNRQGQYYNGNCVVNNGTTTYTVATPLTSLNSGPLEWSCTQLHNQINFDLNQALVQGQTSGWLSGYSSNAQSLTQIYELKHCV